MKILRCFTGVLVALSCLSIGVAFAANHKHRHHSADIAKVTVAAININSADAASLETLNGVGPRKAEAIVAYRKQHGQFKTITDLTKVKGIGDKFLVRLKARNPGKITV